MAISQFRKDPPALSAANLDNYDGDFPCEEHFGDKLSDACPFELSDEIIVSFKNIRVVAPWLAADNSIDGFKKSIKIANLHDAWLFLHSPGWSTSAVVDALEQLTKLASDNAFSLLSNAWIVANKDRLNTSAY